MKINSTLFSKQYTAIFRSVPCILYVLLIILLFTQIVQAQCPINLSKNKIEFPGNLAAVHTKLRQLQDHKDSSFVVVHIGDSHIQLDHFSRAIRGHLHQIFGNCGEGILFPYSACKSFGPRNLETKMSGSWICNTVCNNTLPAELGVTGYMMHTTDRHATMSFRYLPDGFVIGEDTPKVNMKKNVTIWHSAGDFQLQLDCDNCASSIVTDDHFAALGLSRTIIRNYETNTLLKLKFKEKTDSSGQFRFHGISFDSPNSPGIQYHHCGVVGAQFLYFVKHSQLAISQLAAIKPNLIVFSYGSNEGYIGNFDAEIFKAGIVNAMNAIRKNLPEVNFLLTTPPDTRAANKTPPNTKAINQYLRAIAESSGAALWDLHTIMGGDNSVRYWLAHGLARSDKLHFTRSGYRLMGDLFSLAFIQSYNSTTEICVPFATLVDSIAAQVSSHGILPPYAAEVEKHIIPDMTPDPPKKPLTPFKSRSVFHEVARGETLFSIAKRYEETVDQIRAWNGMDSASVLKAGSRIVVKRVE